MAAVEPDPDQDPQAALKAQARQQGEALARLMTATMARSFLDGVVRLGGLVPHGVTEDGRTLYVEDRAVLEGRADG